MTMLTSVRVEIPIILLRNYLIYNNPSPLCPNKELEL